MRHISNDVYVCNLSSIISLPLSVWFARVLIHQEVWRYVSGKTTAVFELKRPRSAEAIYRGSGDTSSGFLLPQLPMSWKVTLPWKVSRKSAILILYTSLHLPEIEISAQCILSMNEII